MVKFKTSMVYMSDGHGRLWKCYDCPMGYAKYAKASFMGQLEKFYSLKLEKGKKIVVALGIEAVSTPRENSTPFQFHPDFPRHVHFEME